MRYLHTMVRVSDLENSLHFYCDLLGLIEVGRYDNEAGRFTLVFLSAADDKDSFEQHKAPAIELTYNWNEEQEEPKENRPGEQKSHYTSGRNFGHLAFQVDDIYSSCQRLMDAGVTINRPPRCGHMAFVRSPDNISIELLQKGQPLAPQEPWISMANSGEW